MIEAMLEGCYLKGKSPPTIITTSQWLKSKIGEKLAPMLETLLKKSKYFGAKVCIFNDDKILCVLALLNRAYGSIGYSVRRSSSRTVTSKMDGCMICGSSICSVLGSSLKQSFGVFWVSVVSLSVHVTPSVVQAVYTIVFPTSSLRPLSAMSLKFGRMWRRMYCSSRVRWLSMTVPLDS